MQEYLNKLNQLGAEYSTRLLGGLAILVFGFWLARVLLRLVERLLAKTPLDGTLIVFANNLNRVVLYGLVLLAALNSIGVPMTSVLALLGTIGLAVALALKDSLNNVAAGISLLILRPFRVGDYIEIGAIGGTVIELNFYHTVLNTPDNRRVNVPNAKAISEVITNFSRNEVRRLDLIYEVAYQTDLNQAAEVLQGLLAADERILPEPAPVVGVIELGNSSIHFAVRPWVKVAHVMDVRFALNQAVKLAFDQAGIEIPFPQRDLRLLPPKQGLPIRLLDNQAGGAA